MSNNNNKSKCPTYKYIKNNSIVLSTSDNYKLLDREYILLYSFFVTYSMCGNQSSKKRTFKDYGWANENLTENKKLYEKLNQLINLRRQYFVFIDKDAPKNILKDEFKKCNLTDRILSDYETERMVILKKGLKNNFLEVCYRIRNCFAHGNFLLKKAGNTKMIVFQDNDRDNVNARMVIKLKTLLNIVKEIDKNDILSISNQKLENINDKNLKKKIS